MRQIVIDPVSRIEGHLRIDTTITEGHVENAVISGTMYRGFENILIGKQPDDARIICQRICGVCPTSHSLAAVDAMEQMLGASLPRNAYLLRNLLLGSEYLHSHILHFYHLCLPDYIDMPTASPWGPSYGGDRRFPPGQTQLLRGHYMEGFRCRQKAHTIGALIGGKMPHCAGVAIGGVTGRLTTEEIERTDQLLDEIGAFVLGKMIPDAVKLEQYYPDYLEIGQGTGNFICYGAFYDPDEEQYLFTPGCKSKSGILFPISLPLVKETSRYSYYMGDTPLSPFAENTLPYKSKQGAYSWIKAPRYMGNVCEVGPFARLAMSGMIEGNSSVIGRIRARVIEAALLVQYMKAWLAQYQPLAPSWAFLGQPDSGYAAGFTEAPRGGLAHYVIVHEGAISRYQVVSPTCWNCSPRDENGIPGLLEQAITGTAVTDEAEPIEVMRVVHSVDPCMACSVH